MSEGNNFRLADGYEALCYFHYRDCSDQKALEYALLTHEHALKSDRQTLIIKAHWWQACLYALRGDEDEATRAFRLGLGGAKQIEHRREMELWSGACRYYEITGAYDKALLLWDEQVQLMNPQTPKRYSYFTVFLRRCFVLRKLGRLTEVDIEQARQAALRMRKPEKYLALMEGLHDGNTEIPRH